MSFLGSEGGHFFFHPNKTIFIDNLTVLYHPSVWRITSCAPTQKLRRRVSIYHPLISSFGYAATVSITSPFYPFHCLLIDQVISFSRLWHANCQPYSLYIMQTKWNPSSGPSYGTLSVTPLRSHMLLRLRTEDGKKPEIVICAFISFQELTVFN